MSADCVNCANMTCVLLSCRLAIRNALNQQTAIQFKQYAEQQYPSNTEQVRYMGYNRYIWWEQYPIESYTKPVKHAKNLGTVNLIQIQVSYPGRGGFTTYPPACICTVRPYSYIYNIATAQDLCNVAKINNRIT